MFKIARILLFIVLFLAPAAAHARPFTTVKNILIREENPSGQKSTLIIPYAFATESLGTTVGVGAMAKGYGQPQLLVGGTVFGSTDEALAAVAGVWDWQVPKTERLFVTLFGSSGWYPRNRAYTELTYQPGDIRAGSNDSSSDQYLEASGYDNWGEVNIEYILPWGSARDNVLQEYHLAGGLLVSDPVGGPQWNPLRYGVTSVALRQNNRYQSYQLEAVGKTDGAIHPFTFAIYHNNTDFPTNPSTGSSQFFALSQNWAFGESRDSWTFWEFEASKYFSLGGTSRAKQRVIALNFWTGDSPTWKEELQPDGSLHITDAPPFLDGARLGGFYRMRGYPSNRFNDKSVIYGTAEYRYTMRWNPITKVSWLDFLQCDWVQLAGFVETGRVASDYHLSELTRDLKIDGGLGIRGMFAGGVARLDFAFSEEGLSAWAMFNQPF